MATPGIVPRIAGWRPISLLRRPFTKKALCRFTLSFVKKEIELARAGVGINLIVPSSLFAYTKPLDDALVFFWGQTIDCGLDLLNSAHTCSLSPSGFCPAAPCLTAKLKED